MNERIKELWERAVFDKSNKDSDAMVQNFAELIVGECCQAVWSEECNTSDLALEEYNRTARKIRQYLGVEK